MKVDYREKELFIKPETEFEEQVLSGFRDCTAYLKCSVLSLSGIKGILIRKKAEEEKAEAGDDNAKT